MIDRPGMLATTQSTGHKPLSKGPGRKMNWKIVCPSVYQGRLPPFAACGASFPAD
jgi:hypothetical protein